MIGNVRYMELEKLYINYDPLFANIQALALGEDLRTSWQKVSAVVRHDSPSKLWEISTRRGRRITTTVEHRFLVFRDASRQTVSATFLQLGDNLAIPNISIDSLINLNETDFNVGNTRVRGIPHLPEYGELLGLFPRQNRGHKPSDITWDEVAEIREVQAKARFVYNLELENNPSFLINGLFVHR